MEKYKRKHVAQLHSLSNDHWSKCYSKINLKKNLTNQLQKTLRPVSWPIVYTIKWTGDLKAGSRTCNAIKGTHAKLCYSLASTLNTTWLTSENILNTNRHTT